MGRMIPFEMVNKLIVLFMCVDWSIGSKLRLSYEKILRRTWPIAPQTCGAGTQWAPQCVHSLFGAL